MKSYVNYLKGLYEAMLSNIAEYDPTLRRDCDRDTSRLLSLVDTRGLPFLMIDLPEAGKHFDKCLSAGLLTPSGVAGFRPYRKSGVIPRLFQGLYRRVFDDFGVLRTDPDVAAIRYIRQLHYGAKKVKVACDDSRTWEHVHEFFEIDQDVRLPSLNWDEDELRIDDLRNLHIGDSDFLAPAPLFDSCHDDRFERAESFLQTDCDVADVVQRTADIIVSVLGGFNPSEWRTKHGPGAVADQRHTHFKYDFPNWPAKLERVFPMALFGFPNYASWAAFSGSQESHELFRANEAPSRLIAVPKTLKGPRLIAAEPVSHQWCQQSILDFLVTRLAFTPIRSSIRFRDQTANQELARRASHTQSHATIDLSNASDRLSCWLVERIFRRSPTLVEAFHASRTRWVANAIDRKSPQFHKLRKFACMGSACTFPVQSYVFAILAVSAVLFVRGLTPKIETIRKVSKEVQVFGDDIIVPIDSWEVLQGLLGDLGLKVNRSKTFGTGKFRESCGLDAYDGHDVTPTYVSTYPDVSRPESITSSVDVHNNFSMKGYYGVSNYVKSTVRSLKRFSIMNVPMGSGSFGWYDHEWIGNDHLKRRFNPFLHRVEVRVDEAFAKSTKDPVKRDSSLLQYFTEVRPVAFIQGDRIGIARRPSTSLRRRWVPLDLT